MNPPEPSLPGPDEKAQAVRTMFDRIAPRYDRLNRVLTLGMDVRWRRRAVRSLELDPGSLVLDLACGTGDLCNELHRGRHLPVGIDVSAGMLGEATTTAPLVQADILHLPLPSKCADGAVCGFALRNVVDLGVLFTEVARAVRPGGRIALLEVAEPTSGVLRAGHRAYFNRVVPAVGGLLSDRQAYRYLPASVSYLPEPQDLLRMVAEAGFWKIERTPLSTGIAQLINATRH